MSVDLTLVIPCYNDGALLEDSLEEIGRVLSQTRYSYEIVLIDDCSPDGSAETVRHLGERFSHIRTIFHPQNVGRGGTVVEGMLAAQGAYVGYLDIDLEVHCRYIPAMLEALDAGADGATACRAYTMQWVPTFVFRAVLSAMYRKLVSFILKLPFQDTEAGYKFFRRERIEPVLKSCQNKGWFWDTEVMALAHYHGLHIVEIPCLFVRRWDKVSTVKPIRDSIQYLKELYRFCARMRRERAS